MNDQIIHKANNVTAEQLGHHVKVRWFECDDDAINFDRHEIVLTISEAADLIQRLAQSVGLASAQLTDDLICGHCPTCNNRRMVRVPAPGGKLWDERCPDCSATRAASVANHWTP